MYQITTHDAPISSARIRMPELCLQCVAGASFESRVFAGVVASTYGVTAHASFKDATLGVRAWSPPV
jgi:hypothetical protein